jgi:hypothetical protein
MANRLKFKIRDLHRDVALVLGFHHRNITSAHKTLENICKGTTYSDMIETIKDDNKWSESHDRTLERLYLAACRVVEMMCDKTLALELRAALLRDLEEWMCLRASELKLTLNLSRATRNELERNGMLSQRPSQRKLPVRSSSAPPPPAADGQ